MLGVLSLVFWSLTLVIVVKYLGFVMRADNHGEGGILALARARSRRSAPPARRRGCPCCSRCSAPALLYGDGMITPAISVLCAVEGLEVATRVARSP